MLADSSRLGQFESVANRPSQGPDFAESETARVRQLNDGLARWKAEFELHCEREVERKKHDARLQRDQGVFGEVGIDNESPR